jgi:hypothetical protein
MPPKPPPPEDRLEDCWFVTTLWVAGARYRIWESDDDILDPERTSVSIWDDGRWIRVHPTLKLEILEAHARLTS